MTEIPPLLFVSGTDTGVGKTLVTALLALRLRGLGARVGVMKPFASGCTFNVNRVLESEDATFLRDALGVDDDLEIINPCRWEEALSPLVASRRAGTPFRDAWHEAKPALETLKKRYDCVVVEGVGGLLAPIFQTENGAIWTNLEIINALGCPAVLVARRTLGTINHTLLTCRVALDKPALFAGIVWCDAESVTENDVAANTSPAIVEEMSGLQSWGEIPFLPDLNRETLLQNAARISPESFSSIPK